MGKIVCFGEALIDFLARPRTAGSPPCFEQHAGGAPANVSVAVARLGGRASFVGAIANDTFGNFLLEALQSAGVETAGVTRTDEAPTALAFVTLDAGGERSFVFYRPPAADLLFRVDDFDPLCFSDTTAFHACSNSLTGDPSASATLEGMARAGAAGALVSFDVNLRPELWSTGEDARNRIRQAMARADIVKLCKRELAFLAGPPGGEEALIERIWRDRARLVVVTDGPAPVRYFTRTAAGSIPAFAVDALDTTAAGDAFMGGFLHWVSHTPAANGSFDAQPKRIEAGLRFAAACGALSVTRYGAFASMPDSAEVQAFLQEHG